MPQLVNGVWVKGDIAAGEIKGGAFHREPTRFRGWITPDGAPDAARDAEGTLTLPAAAGRYHLYVSYLCPWASRTLIFRVLKGLEGVVGLSVAGPILGEDGWVYDEEQDGGPRVGRFRHHHRLYTASAPTYTGKVSVPVLWDRQEGRIVNNESADIIRILNGAFDGLTGNRLDLYPEPLRPEIDRWNGIVYDSVNNGVYRCGFAKSQASYDEAFDGLFATLDRLEAHLSASRYLAGVHLTEADWRLFVTLVRFDAAYHGAFKCNLRRIEEYPNLSAYLRELYQWPGIRDTVRIDAIKAGYYTNPAINPTLIVPKGPALDFERAHDRDRLPGKGIWQRA
ncbi:glutathione S-transferase (plasmid) [Azospirillum sp. B510]|uniref:glutathione S-transferase family protein n=1 Tax=Azospirillum sp. (strain B510) TaxID=137722 RepID=UPI0001C4C93F|nr:glutathione S-transferase family protein [Azospirillum sp. B510]BAI74676.1 glutathione S-transferase [Azospirillum sp. B510]